MAYNRKIDVAVVMPVWSPMRHSLFQAIAQRSDVRLRIFFEKETIDHRPSWQAVSKTAYKWEIIDSFHPKFLKKYRLIPFRLPLVLKGYSPDVIVVVCMAQAVITMLAVCHKKTKVVLWTGESAHILSRKPAPLLVKLLRRVLYPFIDGFGCYSRTTMAFLQQVFDIPASEIFHIPQCVDNSHFVKPAHNCAQKEIYPKTKGSLAENKTVFLTVGRLTSLKGIVQLITAWLKLPPAILDETMLVIAGNGPLREELETQISAGGADCIHLTGFVEFDQLPQLYHHADVFILPSLEDSWGLVINEAMASELPVLCSKYAHAREMVKEGENGFVFDPLDESDILKTVKIMCEQKKNWPEMGRFGRKIAEEYYSVEQSAVLMMKGLEEILK